MVRWKFLDLLQRSASQLINPIQIKYILFCQHLHKFQKNLCRTFRIIDSTMMMMKIDMQRFCHRIKLKTIQLRQQNTRQCYGIQIGKCLLHSQSAAIFFYETDVKSCIMCHQHCITDKFQKLWQNFFNDR